MEEPKGFNTYQPHLFPRLERLGGAIRRIRDLGTVTDLSTSNHIRREQEAVERIVTAFPGTTVVTDDQPTPPEAA